MNYMDENVSCKDYIKLKSKPRLVSRFRFTVNGKSIENLVKHNLPDIYGHQSLAFSTVSLPFALFLSWLRLKKIFF